MLRSKFTSSALVALVLLPVVVAVAPPPSSTPTAADVPELWTTLYAGPNGDDGVSSGHVSPDGSRHVVTGFTRTADGRVRLIATSSFDVSTGAWQWTTAYIRNGFVTDSNGAPPPGRDAASSPDGSRVFVTGLYSTSQAATMALDAATGAVTWSSHYDTSRQDDPKCIAATSGQVFVTGSTIDWNQPPLRSYASFVVAYDAATGTEQWQQTLPMSGTGRHCLALGPDGALFVLDQDGAYPRITRREPTTGALVWSATVPLGDGFEVVTLRVAADNVLLAGRTWFAGASDVAAAALDAATGVPSWTSRIATPASESVRAAAVTPAGDRMVVAGSFPNPAHGNWETGRLTAFDVRTGATVWTTDYDHPPLQAGRPTGDTWATVTITPDGALAVAAGSVELSSSSGATSLRLLSAAFDMDTGVLRWRSDAPTPGPSTYLTATVTPDGSRVLLAGDRATGTAPTPRDWIAAALPTTAAPVAPTGLATQAVYGGIALTWAPPALLGASTLSGYRVYRAVGSGAFDQVAETSTESWTDTAPPQGGTASYVVTAFNAAGEGPASGPASGFAGRVPSAPRNLTATTPLTPLATIRLAWDAPADPGAPTFDGYVLYRGVNGGTPVEVARLPATARQYTDNKQLSMVDTYRYVLKATNAIGIGPASGVACASPSPVVVPVRCL